MRVLLALNQSNSQMIEKLILSAFSPGDEVSCASDQQDLLGTIISRPPDILIYNRFFPGSMSAPDAMKATKRSSPRTRIIFLAGQLDEKAWSECATARIMGIRDVIYWEKGVALQGSQLLNVVRGMITTPRSDADNDSLDRMLESMLGVRVRRPRVYVYGKIDRNLPSDIDKVDLPNDADLIIAAGDPEEAARFFTSLDCSVPIVMVSDFDDSEVKTLVKSNVAAIRPEMLDDFIREFFFPGDGSAPSPAPVKEAVQAAKTGGNIKAKFLGLLKKWGGWRFGGNKKPDVSKEINPSSRTFLDNVFGKKKSDNRSDLNQQFDKGFPVHEDPVSHNIPKNPENMPDVRDDSDQGEQVFNAGTTPVPKPPEARMDAPIGARSAELPEGFVALGHVDKVPSFATVQEVIAAKPHAVLVSGTRWIKELRREKTLVAVPIIVVGDEDPSICMAVGADECISKLDDKSIDLILARAARMKEAWAQAEVDGLTGCYTRKFLDTYLTSERRPRSILMCDLDHFKKVNDTYGHPAGDEVLRQFGQFLRNNVRQVDIVARYGGEEFVVVLPATIEQAAQVAEKICFGWRERVIETDSGVIYSTASVGVAGPDPDAVKHADKALYAAKESGRDRWVRFDQIDQDNPKKPEPIIIPEIPPIMNSTQDISDNPQQFPVPPRGYVLGNSSHRLLSGIPLKQVGVPQPPLTKAMQSCKSDIKPGRGGRVKLPPLVNRDARPVSHSERPGPRGNPLRVLVFTAPQKGFGATTMAIAAARALSRSFHVVVIDADFRNPSLSFRLGLPVRGIDSDWRVNGLGAMKSVGGFYLLPLDMTRQGVDDLGQYMDEICAFIPGGVIVIDAGQDIQVVSGAVKIGVINGDNLDSYVRMYDHLILNRTKRGAGLNNVLGAIPYQSMVEIDLNVAKLLEDKREVILG